MWHTGTHPRPRTRHGWPHNIPRSLRVLAAVAALLTLSPSTRAEAGVLEFIGTSARPETTQVTIQLSGPAEYAVNTLPGDGENPFRIYIDLEGTTLGAGARRERPLRAGPLQRIRTGQFEADRARVVLDLKHEAPYTVTVHKRPFHIVLRVGEMTAKEREYRAVVSNDVPPAVVESPLAASPEPEVDVVLDTEEPAAEMPIEVATATASPPAPEPPPAEAEPSERSAAAEKQRAREARKVQRLVKYAARREEHRRRAQERAETPDGTDAWPASADGDGDATVAERAGGVEIIAVAEAAETPAPPAPAPDVAAVDASLERVALASPAPAAEASPEGRSPDQDVLDFDARLAAIPRPPAPVHIVIDPGHGGRDPGAQSHVDGAWEKDIVLEISHDLAERVRQRLGINVVLTRQGDETVPIHDRAALSQGAQLLVSVHANTCPQSWVKGVQTFYAEENEHAPESRRLARLVHRRVVTAIGEEYGPVEDGGVRTRGLGVLRLSRAPSMLLEAAYLSNPADRERLSDPDYRLAVADGIVDGIADFLSGMPDPRQLYARR
jgi:N-acetylmuramoyl-L-alanine amidase